MQRVCIPMLIASVNASSFLKPAVALWRGFSRLSQSKGGGLMDCHFCEQEAISSRSIGYQDGTVADRPICANHDRFFGWIQSIMAKSVQARLHIQTIPEDKPRSQFH